MHNSKWFLRSLILLCWICVGAFTLLLLYHPMNEISKDSRTNSVLSPVNPRRPRSPSEYWWKAHLRKPTMKNMNSFMVSEEIQQPRGLNVHYHPVFSPLSSPVSTSISRSPPTLLFWSNMSFSYRAWSEAKDCMNLTNPVLYVFCLSRWVA
jgi:hypothetical protein